MSLLLSCNPLVCLTSSSSTSSRSSSTLTFIANPVSRLPVKPIDLTTKLFNGVRIGSPIFRNRSAAVVRVSSDSDGTSPADGSDASAEGQKEAVSVEKLPLESKLQEREEQRLRMRLARKIRLRRKRLVRKRRLRKKGRWPPSKMKKLKNV